MCLIPSDMCLSYVVKMSMLCYQKYFHNEKLESREYHDTSLKIVVPYKKYIK